ncbi:autophagy-related protein 27 [Elsinoe australis]|uniref:Autophagy-related protein 27 n=1 Tax=Elsinoe australis TaxID=40998 RepID=A0A4U7AUK2_9PEZI|nr:autophagy-related protein 27 [Elsinoe australis]
MPRLALPILSLLSLASAVNFDCTHQRVDKVSFDLSKLSGPHTVYQIIEEPPSIANTSFTIDLCKPLTGDSLGRGLKKEEQCPTGTRVCAVERDHNTIEDTTSVRRVIPLAGDFTASHGRALDPKVTRLKNSASNSDVEKEGLRVEFNGGKYPNTRSGREQKAVIELECDKERTGNEEVEKDAVGRVLRREEGEKEGEEDEEKKRSLRFVSYKAEGDEVDVLRVSWRTKYACEDVPVEEGDGDASSGWGFFTWMFIIIFLGAAAYIIFGSWLNYSRYGARGWDLVPHGDSIRDLPYILKDWARSVIDTVQGRGFRGGYSAV